MTSPARRRYASVKREHRDSDRFVRLARHMLEVFHWIDPRMPPIEVRAADTPWRFTVATTASAFEYDASPLVLSRDPWGFIACVADDIRVRRHP